MLKCFNFAPSMSEQPISMKGFNVCYFQVCTRL